MEDSSSPFTALSVWELLASLTTVLCRRMAHSPCYHAAVDGSVPCVLCAVPVSTRVLVITDGRLSSIQSTNLSLLLNLALLSLSRNSIEGVQEEALHGLTNMRTLSLGHNRISSSSLPDDTFSTLRALKVLVLSNNALGTLRGSWFRNTRALTRLLLDGNRITNLTHSSFGGTSLHRLRHLDLSNNFISHIEKDAFQPLPQLQEVDLSRNRLAHMPDVFAPLKHLSLLSLDKNQWRCTCDLQPLARFLGNFVRSSARTLRNAKDLNCQVSIPAVVAAKSMLRLSETDCDAKAPNVTVSLKDRRPLLPQQDVALMTVLAFAGAVGLTCTGLVVFNWKLQQGKANEDTSGNLCCRTFDESLCAHEARNYHAMGYCNCHLTQENELKVMSIVKSRKEKALLQENSHQATWASESTGPDGSFRNPKGKESTSSHSNGRLLQAGCSGAPANRAAFNDTGSAARHCSERAKKLRNLQPGDVQSQTPPQHATRTIDLSSDTCGRGCPASHSALAREGLGEHLTTESRQLPRGRRNSALQPHRQRRMVTSSPPKPQEPSRHSVDNILCKRTSTYDNSCGLFKWNTPMSFQPDNPLICKYVPYDQLQGYLKRKKPKHRGHSNSDRKQIQAARAEEEFLTGEASTDLLRSSARTKKTSSTKSGGFRFQDSDLVGRERVPTSYKLSTYWKQQGHLSDHSMDLDFPKWSHLENKDGREWIMDSQVQKKKRHRQSDLKGKIKGKNLRTKLNLHHFRTNRVHPENPLPELLMKHKQMPSSPKKLARPSKPVSSANFPQQSESNGCVRLASTELPLKHALGQTPKRKRASTPPLSAHICFAGNRVSEQGYHHASSHAPCGDKSTLPPPTAWDAEHCDSHPQFSAEQKEGVSQLGLEVPSTFPASRENASSGDLPPPCPRPADLTAAECKFKTHVLNWLSLSLRNQTPLLGDHTNDTYSKEHTSNQNHALQAEDQNPNCEQLGKEDRTLMGKCKIPSTQIVESCVVDKERNGRGKELLNTEGYNSSPIPWTQPKSSLATTDSSAHQNETERPKEMSTSPGIQSTRGPTTSSDSDSDKGTPNMDALTGRHQPGAPQTGTGEKEEEEGPGERKTNSSALLTDRQKSWEDRASEKHTSQEAGSVEETTVTG